MSHDHPGPRNTALLERPPLPLAWRTNKRAFLLNCWYADGEPPQALQIQHTADERKSVRRRVFGTALLATAVLAGLGWVTDVPSPLRDPNRDWPTFLLWAALVFFTCVLAALEFTRAGGLTRFGRWLLSTVLITPLLGLLLWAIRARPDGLLYIVAITAVLALMSTYLGYTSPRVYPLTFKRVWGWLSNMSTATLICAAYAIYVGRTDTDQNAIVQAWGRLFALATGLVIGIFVGSRVGLFCGRAAAALLRRPVAEPRSIAP